MQENTLAPSVGIDIGTSQVRVVVGQKDNDNNYTVIGVGESLVGGMRKGNVVDLSGPAKAVDEALAQAERMAGLELDQATFNINGSSILSTSVSGMVAVASGEVTEDDLMRLEDVAKVGKVPANRSILSIVPHDYVLDGQADIKDPIGMVGSRLEIIASIVSALAPHVQNLTKIAEIDKINVASLVPSPVAAAQSVLSEQEKESGVALVDFGSATTSLAIYEEGDLRHVSVLPVGSNNITNDLAIGLQTTPDIAEIIKVGYADASESGRDKQVSIKHNKVNHEFNLSVVDEVVNARLEEIFEAVSAQLNKAGYGGRLPSGVVLVGGGSNLKQIESFVRNELNLAVRLGSPKELKGLAEKVEKPEFAVAVGLMMLNGLGVQAPSSDYPANKSGILSKIFGIFKSRH